MATVYPVVTRLDGAIPDVVAVIDLDEFEDDRRDEEWQARLAESRAYRSELRRDGRLG